MKYRILSMNSDSSMERLVNQYIGKGWKPLGGIAVRSSGAGPVHYCQAMILEDDIPDKDKREDNHYLGKYIKID